MKNISRKEWKNIIGIFVISFFLLYPLAQYLIESNNNKLLKSAIKTKAIIVEIHTSKGIHGSYYGIFNYSISNRLYSFKELGDFSKLKLKDTVLIEYAIQDHSVAHVIDRYYMPKYKWLKRK